MQRNKVGIVLSICLLTACEQGTLKHPNDSPYAPTGPARGASVDGLIVGHRLMAAGEYETALKAYFRAGATHGLNVDVYSALGSANLKLGRLGQAEKLLRKAVAKDENFIPAWNNLGVVLIEQGKPAEASRVFRMAYALDSGESDSIRDNLRLAIAKSKDSAYTGSGKYNNFSLVRRGRGDFLLISTP